MDSKFRKGRGGNYFVLDGAEFALSGAEVVFAKVEPGDRVDVVITNSGQIAGLKYDGEKIYGIEEFLNGVESNKSFFGILILVLFLSLGATFTSAYLKR